MMTVPYRQWPAAVRDAGNNTTPVDPSGDSPPVPDEHEWDTRDDAGLHTTDDGASADDRRGPDNRQCLYPSPPEPRAVPPCGEFRKQRLADANQLDAFRQSRETDLARRYAAFGVAKPPFGVFHRLPPFFERCEVPLMTMRADDPQAALRWVEGEPAADGKTKSGTRAPNPRRALAARRAGASRIRPPRRRSAGSALTM